MTVTDQTTTCRFDHEAFVYGSEDEYVGCLRPLLAGAVARGEPTYAVVPTGSAKLLADVLGATASGVSFIDAETWYRRPAETIAAYDRILRELRPGTRATVVGEVQFGDTPRDWLAWTRYESALNRILEQHDAQVVCPYDSRALAPSVVEAAARTHPHVLGSGGSRHSEVYADPEVLLPVLTLDWDVPPGPPAIDLLVQGSTDAARRAFRRAALAAGFEIERVEELTLAVNEVVTNALVHGGGQARLRVWASAEGVTCTVEDEGPGNEDALLGYRPPAPGAERGYGLWLARRIFDDVESRRSSAGGLAVVLDARSRRAI